MSSRLPDFVAEERGRVPVPRRRGHTYPRLSNVRSGIRRLTKCGREHVPSESSGRTPDELLAQLPLLVLDAAENPPQQQHPP